MRVTCPHCGSRSNAEFTFLGDASLSRPGGDAPVSAFTDYVYARENPSGSFREYCQHTGGCRTWLIVTRNVTTHEVSAVESLRADVHP